MRIDGTFECNSCSQLFIAPKSVNRNWKQYTLQHKMITSNQQYMSEDNTLPTPEEWTTIKNTHKAEITAMCTEYITKHQHNTFVVNTVMDSEDTLHQEIHVTEIEATISHFTAPAKIIDGVHVPDYAKGTYMILQCPNCAERAYEVTL